MARGCALAPYNAYRKYYGKQPLADFEALTGETALAARLRALYGTIDNLEWFVGIFAEGYGKAEMMGELLTTMGANDAFTQALTNPLHSTGVYSAATFSAEALPNIEATERLGS